MPPAGRVRKTTKKKRSNQMDQDTRAMCFALRHPPRGEKPTGLSTIQKMVRKQNGKKPTISAISQAAETFKDKKGKRGRPPGTKATTKEEDKKLMKTFLKVRPPGSPTQISKFWKSFFSDFSFSLC
jgi:hypothetical protein